MVVTVVERPLRRAPEQVARTDTRIVFNKHDAHTMRVWQQHVDAALDQKGLLSFLPATAPRPLVSDPILTLRATVLAGFNGSERSRALWTSTTRYLHADIFRLRPGIPYYKCFNRHSAALGVIEWYVRGGPWHPI